MTTNKISKYIQFRTNIITLKIIMIFFISVITSKLFANTLSFSELLTKIQKNSLDLQALQEKSKSEEIANDRNKNHWGPKLYLDLRTYNSNDSAVALMTKLQQQQMENSDFATNSLNSPDRIQAQKGSLLVDWSIYEGSRSTVLSEISDERFKLSKLNERQNKNFIQSEVFKMYFSIVQIENEKNSLEELKKISDKTLNDHQLRKNENPVGYSGFLGLKSLKLQIDSRIESISLQKHTIAQSLNELMQENKEWSVETNLLDLYKSRIENQAKSMNIKTESSDLNVEIPEIKSALLEKTIAEKNKDLESSYWKPQVGAFGEAYTLNGSRGTGSGNTVGLYVRWGFSGQLIGNLDQAKKQALSADYFLKSKAQKIKIKNQNLIDSNKIVDANIDTTKKALEILGEQTAMMKKLYQSGSINSLQLSEVFARHFSLIRQYSELQSQQVMNLSNLIQIYGIDEVSNESK